MGERAGHADERISGQMRTDSLLSAGNVSAVSDYAASGENDNCMTNWPPLRTLTPRLYA